MLNKVVRNEKTDGISRCHHAYDAPAMEVIRLEVRDVIRTSGLDDFFGDVVDSIIGWSKDI